MFVIVLVMLVIVLAAALLVAMVAAAHHKPDSAKDQPIINQLSRLAAHTGLVKERR